MQADGFGLPAVAVVAVVAVVAAVLYLLARDGARRLRRFNVRRVGRGGSCKRLLRFPT